MSTITLKRVESAADRKAFVDLVWKLYAHDPHWVPPLKSEMLGLIGGEKSNPWFGHAEAAFWLALKDGEVVGRISAQVDQLVIAPGAPGAGPGTGHFGMFECIDDPAVAEALVDAAEDWLRQKGMTRAMGPFSLSVWDEPGLLVQGFEGPPTVMMGHHLPTYERMVAARGYTGVKDLHCWSLPIAQPFPEMVQRIVAFSERNAKLVTRPVDKSKFDQEAALILDILNDAWSDNWGFVPLTPAEIAYVGKKLKPIIFEGLVRVAEYEGVPVGFMITLPDINELTRDLNGNLFPFGWAKLLWRLRAPKVKRMRVPLMGVVKKLQATRLASQLAFMMVAYIRHDSTIKFGASRGEFGWVLDDNGPMQSVGEAMNGEINKVYRIYEKPL
jgi:hypothetical protein